MTDADRVRLLIHDKEVPHHYSDTEIDEFLDIADDVLYIAAALALEAWATSVTDGVDSEKIGDYAYTKKESAGKLTMAKHYRALQAELDAAPSMTWAEMDLASVGETLEDE